MSTPWFRSTLAESRPLRFTTVTLLYVAQGFPIGLFDLAMPAWLLAQGLTLAEVGAFGFVAGLPWGFKVLVAPLMDRYQFLPMGRRRPWILAAQFCSVLAAAGLMLTPNPADGLTWLMVLAFIVNTCAATQDVAVDGMAIDLLPPTERGRANSFMMGGQVAGLSLSGAIAGALLPIGGIPLAALAMALLGATIALLMLFARERPGERLLPWSQGDTTARPDLPPPPAWWPLIKQIVRAVLVPMSLLLVLVEVMMRLSAGMSIVLFPSIARETLGIASDDYAYFRSTTSAIAALFGLVAGLLIDRVGAQRMFTASLVLTAAILALASAVASSWHTPQVAAGLLIAFEFASQWVMVSMIALFMGACAPSIAATQFATYMMFANLARSFGAGFYGEIGESISNQHAVALMALLIAAAAVLSLRIDMSKLRRD